MQEVTQPQQLTTKPQAIYLIVFSPIALIACLINIYTVFKFQKYRFQSNLLIVTSIYMAIIEINFFINGVYQVATNTYPNNDSSFCIVSSILQIVGRTGVVLYSLKFALLITVKLQMGKSLRKIYMLKQRYFHVFATLTIIGFTLYNELMPIPDLIGLNQQNICSINKSLLWEDISNGLLFLLYVSLSVYSYITIKKMIPEQDEKKMQKQEFLLYYSLYTLLFAIIWLILILTDLITVLQNQYFQKFYFKKIEGTLQVIFFYLSVNAILMLPWILFILRMRNKRLRERFIRSLTKCFNQEQELETALNQKSDQISLALRDTLHSSSEGSPEYFFSSLVSKVRLGLIVTVLSGISSFSKEIMKELKSEILDSQPFIKQEQTIQDITNYREGYETLRISSYQEIHAEQQNKSDTRLVLEIKYNFDYQLISETKKFKMKLEHINEQTDKMNLNFQFFETIIISYCPTIFSRVLFMQNFILNQIQNQNEFCDVHESFKLENNKIKIKEFSLPSGGKSGEFFYFSQDDKLILKTASPIEIQVYKYLQDFQALIKQIDNYYLHFLENPNSLICKIVGLFNFNRNTSDEKDFNILVMQSVAAIPRKYIIRTYDLKGSRFDRQVLNKIGSSQNLSTITLKDLDFFKLEQHIKVDKHYSIQISETLMKDADFFKSCGLMDYSLLVMKIDLKLYSIENMITIDQALETKFNLCVPSNVEDGIYYSFGIIDYLQQWNVEKGLEKNAKKILNFNSTLDTSAQKPSFYSERFKMLVQKIFVCDQ